MTEGPDPTIRETLGRDLTWEREPSCIRTVRWHYREGFYWESQTHDHLTTDLQATLAWVRAQQDARPAETDVWQVQLIVDDVGEGRGAVNVLGYDPVERDSEHRRSEPPQ